VMVSIRGWPLFLPTMPGTELAIASSQPLRAAHEFSCRLQYGIACGDRSELPTRLRVPGSLRKATRSRVLTEQGHGRHECATLQVEYA
jgi:hypothetical protein